GAASGAVGGAKRNQAMLEPGGVVGDVEHERSVIREAECHLRPFEVVGSDGLATQHGRSRHQGTQSALSPYRKNHVLRRLRPERSIGHDFRYDTQPMTTAG